jgi:hypothetical protein
LRQWEAARADVRGAVRVEEKGANRAAVKRDKVAKLIACSYANSM